MSARYALMFALLVIAVAVPSRLDRGTSSHLPMGSEPGVAAHELAARAGHSRASWIFGEYLALAKDTSSGSLLMKPGAGSGRAMLPAVGLLSGSSVVRLPLRSRDAGFTAVSRSAYHGSPPLGHYLESMDQSRLDHGLEALRRGLVLGATGQTLVALAALDQAVSDLPWMADWANYWAAEIIAPSGDTAAVRRRLESAGPDLFAVRGWRVQVEAARRAGDLKLARQITLDAARATSPAAARSRAWALLGDLRTVSGDTALAREAYRSAMEGAPASAGAVDAARALSRLGPGPEEWRMIAGIYHRHGNQARAIHGFEAYLASGAGALEERAHARLRLGLALLAAGRATDAERHLLELSREPVPERIAAEAMYQAGRAQYSRGRRAQARNTFLRVAELFPGQDGTARALYRLAHLQHHELDMDGARENYRRAADASPTLAEAGIARLRLGGLQYLAGDYDKAAATFEEYIGHQPNGRLLGQARYWTARSYLRLERVEEAEALLRQVRQEEPVSYYGIGAGELLGQTPLSFPMDAPPPRRVRTDSMVRNGLLRVQVLEELGRSAEAASEIERLRNHFARTAGGDYALAEALAERGRTLAAISVGWEIHHREGTWNPRLLRLIHPFPFQDLVVPEAGASGIDPYLVAAVIRRESAFDPTVRSSVGAIGLMQIMPRTGQGLARELSIANYRTELLRQPELNVHLGVRYLSNLLRQYDGDLALALAAYNAGPGRANRWRQLPEVGEPALFMERIPFDETREYVRNVKIYLALYRELYPAVSEAMRELRIDVDD